MKICLKCGETNPDHYETCSKCGSILIKEDIAQGFPIKETDITKEA